MRGERGWIGVIVSVCVWEVRVRWGVDGSGVRGWAVGEKRAPGGLQNECADADCVMCVRASGDGKQNFTYPQALVDALLGVLRPGTPYVSVVQSDDGLSGRHQLLQPQARMLMLWQEDAH